MWSSEFLRCEPEWKRSHLRKSLCSTDICHTTKERIKKKISFSINPRQRLSSKELCWKEENGFTCNKKKNDRRLLYILRLLKGHFKIYHKKHTFSNKSMNTRLPKQKHAGAPISPYALQVFPIIFCYVIITINYSPGIFQWLPYIVLLVTISRNGHSHNLP